MENQEKDVVFQETELTVNFKEHNIFDDPNNYEFLFSMSFSTYLNRNQKKKNQNIERNRKKIKDKIILILFSEIEEIIERRFLLMWQVIEIFKKMEKAIILFSEERNNRIIEFFKSDDKIKNLIHSRNNKKMENLSFATYEYPF